MRQMLEDKSNQLIKAVQGVYDVLVLDPPWPVQVGARKGYPGQVMLAYPTMPVELIRHLSLPLADAAHVWVWATHRFLPDALACLEGWGLHYICTFVWIKAGGMQVLGLPQLDCEFALYARKGPAVLLDTKDLKTTFTAPRGAHSEKPDVFYAMVRRVTAGRRLDMFGRRSIEGFESWGLDAPTAEETA
jgi:N6-adenosine-specific RNA methylase IME4